MEPGRQTLLKKFEEIQNEFRKRTRSLTYRGGRREPSCIDPSIVKCLVGRFGALGQTAKPDRVPDDGRQDGGGTICSVFCCLLFRVCRSTLAFASTSSRASDLTRSTLTLALTSRSSPVRLSLACSGSLRVRLSLAVFSAFVSLFLASRFALFRSACVFFLLCSCVLSIHAFILGQTLAAFGRSRRTPR